MKRGDLLQEMFWNNTEMSIYEKAEFFNKVIGKITWQSEKFKRKGTLTIHYKNGDRIDIEMTNK